MNYPELITEIKSKLTEAGFSLEANRILEEQLVLGTVGESFSSVCHLLRDTQFQKSPAYKSVEPQVRKLLIYAASIGY